MIEQKLANNIKALRMSRKLTLRQLADRLGIGFTSIQQWEKGKKYPTIPHLYKVCEFFNVQIEDMWK